MKVKHFLIVILFTFCASYYCNAQKSIDIKGKYSATININKIVDNKKPVELSKAEIEKRNIDLKKVEAAKANSLPNEVVIDDNSISLTISGDKTIYNYKDKKQTKDGYIINTTNGDKIDIAVKGNKSIMTIGDLQYNLTKK